MNWSKWFFIFIAGVLAVIVSLNLFGILHWQSAWGNFGALTGTYLNKVNEFDLLAISLAGLIAVGTLILLIYYLRILLRENAFGFLLSVIALGIEITVGYYAFHHWPLVQSLFKKEVNLIKTPYGWGLIGFTLFVFITTFSWLKGKSKREITSSSRTIPLVPIGGLILNSLKGIMLLGGVVVLIFFGYQWLDQMAGQYQEQEKLKAQQEFNRMKEKLYTLESGARVPSELVRYSSKLKGGKLLPNFQDQTVCCLPKLDYKDRVEIAYKVDPVSRNNCATDPVGFVGIRSKFGGISAIHLVKDKAVFAAAKTGTKTYFVVGCFGTNSTFIYLAGCPTKFKVNGKDMLSKKEG